MARRPKLRKNARRAARAGGREFQQFKKAHPRAAARITAKREVRGNPIQHYVSTPQGVSAAPSPVDVLPEYSAANMIGYTPTESPMQTERLSPEPTGAQNSPAGVIEAPTSPTTGITEASIVTNPNATGPAIPDNSQSNVTPSNLEGSRGFTQFAAMPKIYGAVPTRREVAPSLPQQITERAFANLTKPTGRWW